MAGTCRTERDRRSGAYEAGIVFLTHRMVCRLVLNSRAKADTPAPSPQPLCHARALIRRQACRSANHASDEGGERFVLSVALVGFRGGDPGGAAGEYLV